MKDTYIQAVTTLLADNQSVDDVLTNLQAVLKKRGHERLYDSILKGVVTKLEQQSAKDSVKVAVATATDSQAIAVRELLKELEAVNASVLLTIDPTLIGGAKATYQNRQIDQTFKTALRHLYERVAV